MMTSSSPAVLQDMIPAVFEGVLTPAEIETLRQEAMEEWTTTEPNNNNKFYADRFVRAMMNIAEDPDCQSREFDVAAADEQFLDLADASRVLHKCRLLVLRNALNTTVLSDFKLHQLTPYVNGIRRGKVSTEGTTSNNEDHIINESAQSRYVCCTYV